MNIQSWAGRVATTGPCHGRSCRFSAARAASCESYSQCASLSSLPIISQNSSHFLFSSLVLFDNFLSFFSLCASLSSLPIFSQNSSHFLFSSLFILLNFLSFFLLSMCCSLFSLYLLSRFFILPLRSTAISEFPLYTFCQGASFFFSCLVF